VHCYSAERREEIKIVMKWAGPRMLLHHPLLAIAQRRSTRSRRTVEARHRTATQLDRKMMLRICLFSIAALLLGAHFFRGGSLALVALCLLAPLLFLLKSRWSVYLLQLSAYGAAAVEVMQRLGVYEAVRPKLVQGENIAQTYQFVASGNAQLGFIALSQITKGGKVSEGSWWVVPSHYYSPIEQSAVMLPSAKDSAAAQAFVAFLKGPQAAAVIRSYGYELPGK